MKIIDTHCHLDLDVFSLQLETILAQSMAMGVSDFIIPGVTARGWERILSLSKSNTSIHASIGLHPLYLKDYKPDDLDRLDLLCQQETIVAIGEVGLDLYRANNTTKQQEELFINQVLLAKKYSLPLLIHARKAHDQVMSILRRLQFDNGGIVHAFNGSRQQADIYIEYNFKLGFGGNITYERAKRIRQLATTLPINSIVLETDAPDIPLANHREQINSPVHLPEILHTLASLRKESLEEMATQTSQNVRQVLNL